MTAKLPSPYKLHATNYKAKRVSFFCRKSGMNGMGADHFFHPDDVIPTVEFVAAVVETADQGVAKALMEVQAAVGDIRVLVVTGYGNAGVDVEYSHGFQGFFQGLVQLAANAVFTGVYIDVDARFNGPGIGFTAIECMSIGITDDLAVYFGTK